MGPRNHGNCVMKFGNSLSSTFTTILVCMYCLAFVETTKKCEHHKDLKLKYSRLNQIVGRLCAHSIQHNITIHAIATLITTRYIHTDRALKDTKTHKPTTWHGCFDSYKLPCRDVLTNLRRRRHINVYIYMNRRPRVGSHVNRVGI